MPYVKVRPRNFAGNPSQKAPFKVNVQKLRNAYVTWYAAVKMALAKAQAERNAKQSQERIDEDQERLAMAERNMRKMLAKVNEETQIFHRLLCVEL